MFPEWERDSQDLCFDSHWDWKWEKHNEQLHEDRTKYVELYRGWREKGDDMFSSGLSLREFHETREIALKGVIALEGVDIQFGLGEVIREECGPQTDIFNNWLIRKGIVVRKEVSFLYERYGGGVYDPESLGLIDEAVSDSYESAKGKAKLSGLNEALSEMKKKRNEGERVVVSLGTFDVGTEGQNRALDSFSWTAQEFGSVFVFVSGDEEVKLVKGLDRPYLDLDRRMNHLAGREGVTSVSPLAFGGAKTKEELVERYEAFHQMLSGVAHIRVVGDRDDYFPIYLKQCNDTSILLVSSDFLRTSPATEIGRQLYGK